MTDAAQRGLLRVYETLAAVGSKPPTNALVFAACRAVGLVFGDREAKTFLAAVRGAVPGHAPSVPLGLSTIAPALPDAAPASYASASHGGAGEDVLVKDSAPIQDSNPTPPPPPSQPEAVAEGERPALFAVPDRPAAPTPPPVKAPRQTRFDTRSPAAQVADAAIASLRPTISPALHGMTWTDWVKRNRRVMVSMATSGMSAEDIVAAHQEASDARGEVAVVMAWVQERVVRQGSRGGQPRAGAAPEDDMQTGAELAAAEGLPEIELKPWERRPSDPLWRPRSAFA